MCPRLQPPGGRVRAKKEVLKFQHEDGRVREKCDALQCPKAMFPCFSQEVEAGSGVCSPYHAGAVLGPRQSQRRVSGPCAREGSVHACVHCHGLGLRQQPRSDWGWTCEEGGGQQELQVKMDSPGLSFTHLHTFVQEPVQSSAHILFIVQK